MKNYILLSTAFLSILVTSSFCFGGIRAELGLEKSSSEPADLNLQDTTCLDSVKVEIKVAYKIADNAAIYCVPIPHSGLVATDGEVSTLVSGTSMGNWAMGSFSDGFVGFRSAKTVGSKLGSITSNQLNYEKCIGIESNGLFKVLLIRDLPNTSLAEIFWARSNLSEETMNRNSLCDDLML